MATKPQTTTVFVEEEVQPVFIADPETKKPQKIGEVFSRVFKGESAQRHFFVPADQDSGDDPRAYALGVTSERFRMIDHYDVISPLIEGGFELTRQIPGRGGLTMISEFRPNSAAEYQDPITWDEEFWNDRGRRTRDSYLSEMITVTTSIRPGKGISIRRGYFRLICTNGLTAKILDLGSISFTHTNWDPNRMVTNTLSLNRNNGVALGPMIGNREGVHKTLGFLTTTLPILGTPEASVPVPIRNRISILTRIPNWWLQGIMTQLVVFVASGQATLHALDVANMVTTPLYLEENSDREISRAIRRQSSVIQAIAEAIAVHSL